MPPASCMVPAIQGSVLPLWHFAASSGRCGWPGKPTVPSLQSIIRSRQLILHSLMHVPSLIEKLSRNLNVTMNHLANVGFLCGSCRGGGGAVVRSCWVLNCFYAFPLDLCLSVLLCLCLLLSLTILLYSTYFLSFLRIKTQSIPMIPASLPCTSYKHQLKRKRAYRSHQA